jgi:hypothetical protein
MGPQAAVDRFHNYYKQQQFDRLYAEYDTEYSTEISLQKNIEMFHKAWTNLGGFVSATSAHAVVGTRAGQQVLIVTDSATFEGAGIVWEEFDFKLGTTVGKLPANFVESLDLSRVAASLCSQGMGRWSVCCMGYRS